MMNIACIIKTERFPGFKYSAVKILFLHSVFYKMWNTCSGSCRKKIRREITKQARLL